MTYHAKLEPNSVIATVIVPTRNRSAKIRKCLEGLQRQTQHDFEIIVVDDGSIDDTREYLQSFVTDRPDIDFHSRHHPIALGANPSRNRAIQESCGEFVAFLDDDCVPQSDWLQRLLAGFAAENVAAVTGHVENVRPRNLFELSLKGTQRVHGDRRATRLVGCNMCVRRSILMDHPLDEDRAGPATDMAVSGRGDEEGLFLSLRAAGYEQLVIRDAIVSHDHPHHCRSFLRQAWRSGLSTARLGYKYRLRPRVELMPLLLAYATLPMAGRFRFAWLVPTALATLFVAAIVYNELFRKRKAILEVAATLPLMLVYYHLRLLGYVYQWCRLAIGIDKIRRVRFA